MSNTIWKILFGFVGLRRIILQENNICFKVQIVDECNLNCKGCDHFSPLAKKWHQPLDDFISMIKALKEKTDGNIKEIVLYGGEPLLHENLLNIIFATNVILPNIHLTVETNGILLMDFLDKHYSKLKKINLEWKITEYLPTKGIVQKIKNKYCKLNIAITKQFIKEEVNANYNLPYKTHLFKININTHNDKDKAESNFSHCYVKTHETNSIVLRDWKLYPCPITACIDILNNDYVIPAIDLHDNINFEMILSTANNQCDFCGRCGLIEYGLPYEISSKDVS